jgi:L-cystine uptake protein TcyP (sodium:dicarboxylate symporter family)
MVTLQKSSKSLEALIMSFIIGMILIGFWVLKPLAFPSRILPVGALVTWFLRRSTSSLLMMIAL